MKKNCLKLLLLSAVVMLSGCAAGVGLVGSAIDAVNTPKTSIEACEGVKGQTLYDVKTKIFNDPDVEPVSITDAEGGREYRYRKGSFNAKIIIADGKIVNIECWKGGSQSPAEQKKSAEKHINEMRMRAAQSMGYQQIQPQPGPVNNFV